MTPDELRLWVKNYVTQMETNGQNPYQADFAGGKSGLSYGSMQNDISNGPNSKAYQTLMQILLNTESQTGLDDDDVDEIMNVASQHGANANSLNNDPALPSDTVDLIDDALADSAGSVDRQDNSTLNNIMNNVNGAIEAAQDNPNGPGQLDPSNPNLQFIGELAEWGNRTEGLSDTDDYLSGATTVSQSNFDANYLSQQAQFAQESFSNWESRVTAATSGAENALLEQGLYIPQSGDQGAADSDTWNNIASHANPPISGSELEKLNKALGGNSGTDGLVYVPNADTPVGASPDNLSNLPPGQAYVYDPTTGKAYAVAPEFGDGSPGTLYTLDSNGNPTIFAPGTWQNISASSDGSSTNVNLQDDNNDNIGNLSVNNTTGDTSLTGSGPSPTKTFSHSNGRIYVIKDGHGGLIVGQLNGPAYDVGSNGTITDIANPFNDGGSTSLPPWTNILNNLFGAASIDPIVMDLSGNNSGVQLTSLASSNAHFDLYGTGFAVHTGWVGATTGILVNSATPTSISNVFGSFSVDGFTALQAADTNHDGVINSSDSSWSGLYVWKDTNGNGVADSGEVHTLSSLGITSISLAATPVSETVNGNVISQVANFTYSNNTTGQVAEAFFNNSQMDSTYTGNYTLNSGALLLPSLRGYGTIAPMYIAASQNQTLFSLVQGLASDTLSDAATFDQQVRAILYQWAGVENVDPTSRGSYVDAQELETLEAFTGEGYVTNNGASNPASSHQGATLHQAFNALMMNVEMRLLAQGPLASYLSGTSYDYNTDAIVGTVNLSSLLTAIGANIPANNGQALQYLVTMTQFFNTLSSNLGMSSSSYTGAMQSYFSSLGYSVSTAEMANIHMLAPTYDTNGNAIFTPDSDGAAFAGVQGITNKLNAVASTGSTDLTNDYFSNIQTLIANEAILTNSEFNGFTSIQGAGTLYLADAGVYNLADKGASSFSLFAQNNAGTILIGNAADGEQFNASVSGNDVLQSGNGNNDTLVGGAGHDVLIAGSGTDRLIAGSGNLTMIGGAGADEFDLGSGMNSATGGAGADRFIIGTGVASVTGGYYGNSTFYLYNALAAGSSLNGLGSNNFLIADGNFDLSQSSIRGIQTLNVANGCTVTLTQQEYNSFTTVNGNYSIVSGGTTATLGSNVTLTEPNASTLTVNGTGSVITTSASSIAYQNAWYDDVLNGNGNAITAQSGNSFRVNGSNDNITMNSATVTLSPGATGITVNGTGNTVWGNAADLVTVVGVNNGFYTWNSTVVMQNAYYGDTVGGDNNTIAGATYDGFNVAGDDCNISGSYETIVIGNGYTGDTITGDYGAVWANGNDVYTVAGNHNTSDLWNSTVTVKGTNDTITTHANDTVIDLGKNNTLVSVAGGDNVFNGTASALSSDAFQSFDGHTDSIIFSDHAFVSGVTSVSWTPNAGSSNQAGILSVSDASGTFATLNIAGENISSFNVAADSNGNVKVTDPGATNIINPGTTNMVIMDDSSGQDNYQLPSNFQNVMIENIPADGTSIAHGNIDFGAGVASNQLWFEQKGGNLQIDLLGTNEEVTVAGWYAGNNGAQVQSVTDGGQTLDNQLQNLVQAMASYTAANPGFNPTAASTVPSDPALQSTLAAAWH